MLHGGIHIQDFFNEKKYYRNIKRTITTTVIVCDNEL